MRLNLGKGQAGLMASQPARRWYESMTEFSHFDEHGSARMVDVGSKAETLRNAVASGRVVMKPETLQLIRNREIRKGDVLELARVAGIMASKRVADLIPLCHPIRIDSVEISIEPTSETEIKIQATVTAVERTGVEMEALTAVSATALTIYDMCKSVDRAMRITDIQVEAKSGGKSGTFQRDPSSGS
jgi:cyclic pyranopterin phosphate synthase